MSLRDHHNQLWAKREAEKCHRLAFGLRQLAKAIAAVAASHGMAAALARAA